MCSVGRGNAHLIGKITRRHFVPGTNEPSNKNSSFYSSAYVSKDSRPEEFGFVWNIVHRDKNGRGWNPGDINISDMRLFKDPPWPPFRSSFDFQQSLGKKKNLRISPPSTHSMSASLLLATFLFFSRLPFKAAAAERGARSCFINSSSLKWTSWRASDSIMTWRIDPGRREARRAAVMPRHLFTIVSRAAASLVTRHDKHREASRFAFRGSVPSRIRGKTGGGGIAKCSSPVSFFTFVRASGRPRLIYILTPKEACSKNACWVIEMMVFGIFQHPGGIHSATDDGLPDQRRSCKHLPKLPQGLRKTL